MSVPELIRQNMSIPTAVIEQDIADTEFEIATMKREAEGYRLIGDKLSLFRASARESGILEREEFIVKLKSILDWRKVN